MNTQTAFCEFCPIEWESEAGDYMCLDQYKEKDCKGLYMLCFDELDWKEPGKISKTDCKSTRKRECVIWIDYIEQN